jgi:RNA polymerase sigma factor (sigma-70 family)
MALIEDLYISLWEGIERAGIIREMSSYVERSLVNRIKSHLRDAVTSKEILNHTGLGVSLSQFSETDGYANVVDIEKIADTRESEATAFEETCMRVELAMNAIPIAHAVCLWTHYVEGLSIRAISRKWGVPHTTLDRDMVKARAALREAYLRTNVP